MGVNLSSLRKLETVRPSGNRLTRVATISVFS